MVFVWVFVYMWRKGGGTVNGDASIYTCPYIYLHLHHTTYLPRQPPDEVDAVVLEARVSEGGDGGVHVLEAVLIHD